MIFVHRALAVVAFLVCMACQQSPAKRCAEDSDCVPGSTCDTARSVCVSAAGGGGGGGGSGCACPAHAECVEGACAARYSALVLEQLGPAPLKPSASFTARASLTLAAGRQENPPAKLALVLRAPDGGTSLLDLPRVGAAYEAVAQAPALEGRYRLSARYDEASLESASVDLVVDGTPPALQLTLQPPPLRPPAASGTTYADPAITDGGAYRRDEQVAVTVSANEALDAATVSLTAAIGTGTATTVSVQPQPLSACGVGAVYCGTATLSLWQPSMNGFRQRLSMTATASDLAGNTAQSPAVGAHVTRFKWRYEAGTTVSSPALDSAGNLYVVAGPSGLAATLRSLSSAGTLRFSVDAGVAGTSPAVGREDGGEARVFWGSGGTTSGLFVASSRDGGLLGACAPYSGGFEGGLGLMSTSVFGELVESAVGLSSGNGGTLVGFRPGATNGPCISRAAAGTMPTDPSSIVSHQGSVFFGNAAGQVASYSFNGAASTWDPRSGWPAGANLFTRALAVVGSEIVGGGGGPSQGGAFSLVASSGGTPSWEYRTTAPAWSPAVADGGQVLLGVDGPNFLSVRIRTDAGTLSPTTDVVRGTPVIGEGGFVYLVSVDGTLSVRSLPQVAVPAWEHQGLGQVRASASLDCARDAAGQLLSGRPGTLYVPALGGELHAIIVDSRGLDSTAPWPKYQRDIHNSGDPSRQIVPCP